MRGESASPLVPLKRKEKGPRGRQPDTITTNPEVVVEIIRKAYVKICTGSVHETKVPNWIEDYMEKYKEFIYKAKEVELDDITEEDVQEEMRMLKETVGGMDQWTPNVEG